MPNIASCNTYVVLKENFSKLTRLPIPARETWVSCSKTRLASCQALLISTCRPNHYPIAFTLHLQLKRQTVEGQHIGIECRPCQV